MTSERADLVETLRERRGFLLHTVQGLSDEDAARTPTVSQLCLGGLIKHCAAIEEGWMRFALGQDMGGNEAEFETGFRMMPGETLAGLVANYERVAKQTDELVETLDLDTSYPLPPAPWFPPGKEWSVRRVVLHVIGETAHHSGHADILREAIDGQKTMG